MDRRTASGRPLGPDERVPVATAVALFPGSPGSPAQPRTIAARAAGRPLSAVRTPEPEPRAGTGGGDDRGGADRVPGWLSPPGHARGGAVPGPSSAAGGCATRAGIRWTAWRQPPGSPGPDCSRGPAGGPRSPASRRPRPRPRGPWSWPVRWWPGRWPRRPRRMHVQDEGMSILTSWTGSRLSRESDEYPVPKSSMAMRTPSSDSWRQDLLGAVGVGPSSATR